jgi:hypothetical protein
MSVWIDAIASAHTRLAVDSHAFSISSSTRWDVVGPAAGVVHADKEPMNRRVGDRLVCRGLAHVSVRLAVARHYPLPAQKRDGAAYSMACFGSQRRLQGMPRCLFVAKG